MNRCSNHQINRLVISQTEVRPLFQLTFSILSTCLAICAFGLSFLTYRRLRVRDSRDDADRFLLRNNSFEAKLGDWEEAQALYGIDTEGAKSEQISFRQIAYLILVANAVTTYAQHTKSTSYEILREREYSRMLFSQALTKRTWKYARHCISDPTRKAIDRYIRELEEPGDMVRMKAKKRNGMKQTE